MRDRIQDPGVTSESMMLAALDRKLCLAGRKFVACITMAGRRRTIVGGSDILELGMMRTRA